MKYLKKLMPILPVLMLLLSTNLYSQTPIKIPQGLQHSNDNINQDDWNLVDYQFKVDEIQVKIDYVKNNPKENENSEEWLKKAYKLLSDAKFERDTHIEKYKYKIIKGFPQKIIIGNSKEDYIMYDKNVSEWIHAHPLTQKDHSQ